MASHDFETLEVALTTPPQAYDIIIGRGVLAQSGALITPLLSRKRAVIITDDAVAKHHLAPLTASLEAHGIAHDVLTLPNGEATKSFTQLESLLAWLSEKRIERQDLLIALGGGVVGDLAGFAASIFQRGIRFVQIPTTLLAQVDSSVGGKTAINVAYGKNLVGAFHHPALVLSDIDTLGTLPIRECRAGYAEIVKYGALGDADFFDWLETEGGDVLALKSTALIRAVRASCAMKADIVMRDAREQNQRALLNLGHSFAHAVEALCRYDGRVLHGEAVAFGMVLAFKLSVALGVCETADAARLEAHLCDTGLPTKRGDIDAAGLSHEAIYDAMRHDKKMRDGEMKLVLARRLGDAFVTSIDGAHLREFLSEHFD